MGPVPSHSDLDAPVAHRIRPRLVAAARTGRAWIRSGRVCAVLAALERGDIAPARYHNLLQLLANP